MKRCPDCGAYLDAGERCDCQEQEKTAPGAETSESGKTADKPSD